MANDKVSVCSLRCRRYRQGQRGQGTARGTSRDRKDRFRHHPRTRAPASRRAWTTTTAPASSSSSCIENDQVVEHNFYNGNYYGTLRESEVEKRLEAGKVVVLVIDVHGAANIRRMFPGATTVFLLPPSVEELEHRLRGRGTETEESIQERLATARQELAEQDKFTVKLVNDQVDALRRRAVSGHLPARRAARLKIKR